MAETPEALLRELRENRTEAVSRVVHEHAGDLLRAARGMGLPETEAEELVQASFTAFLEAIPRFEGRSTIRTFLFGILYRKALEQGRRKARELATDPADALFDSRFTAWGHWSAPPRGPAEEADVQELAVLLGRCLDELSPQQRAAFQLKEIDREPGDSICNVLGIQDTNLRVLLFRARNKLRDCIEKKWKGGRDAS